MSGPLRLMGVAAVVSVVGCSPVQNSPATDRISPAPSTVDGTACPSVDLRTPGGSPVSLSGTWIGVGGIAEGVFYLYQTGSCVWWSGGYPTSRTAEGHRYDELGWVTFVFMGTLTSDFTVGGTWSVVRLATEGGNRHWGTVTYALDVSDSQGPILRRSAMVGERGVPLPETMTRVSEQAVPPP